MTTSLSYADAVKLLRDSSVRFAEVADRLSASGMLGAAIAVPEVLGWFDARSEVARLSRELMQHLQIGQDGTKRFDRTRRIEAAHSLIVVTAYFEVVQEHRLPVDFDRFALTRAEQAQVGTGVPVGRARVRDLAEATLHSPAPFPSPQWGHDRIRAELQEYYRWLSNQLIRFLSGLAAWEALTEAERASLERILTGQVPTAAVARYEELIRRLAVEVPEVRLWIELREHVATRDVVRTGFASLRQILDRFPSVSPLSVQVEGLIIAYGALLSRPIVESQGLPEGLSFPTVAAGYIDPYFRSLTQYDTEGWRTDLLTAYLTGATRDSSGFAEFFAAHLATTQATQAPLLVLGQPGSGKSLLTKVLAAQLADSGFLPVRVALGEVPADSDVQDQIEYAVRAATGERVSWPDLVREAGNRQPAVLFDGLDELEHASGLDHRAYLAEVKAFQQREFTMGRPVAVVITSRTGYAGRLEWPEGSVVIELTPFTRGQIIEWVRHWNTQNRAYFRAHGLHPLDLDAVLRQEDLADQPLLLLLLALYDATGNALLHGDQLLSTAELYEHVMVSFTEREVLRLHPTAARGSRGDVGATVAGELDRLSIAAFACLNRGRPSITEYELDEDLRILLQDETSEGGSVIGRFFFVHESTALTAQGNKRAFEFLHATFAEFLVARLIARLTANLEVTAWGSSDTDRHAILRALLSFTVLSATPPLLPLIEGCMRTLDEGARQLSITTLTAMAGAALGPWPPTPYDSYQPQQLPTPTRHAAHSANLVVLLLISDPTPLSVRALFRTEQDPLDLWAHHAALWRSSLSHQSWPTILAVLRGRRRPGVDRDLLLIREDGSPVSHRDSASLAFYADPEFEVTEPEDVVVKASSTYGHLLRTASLLVDHDFDILLDALAPYVAHHGDGDLSRPYDSATSAARDVIAAIIAEGGAPSLTGHPDTEDPITPPPPPSTLG